MTTVMVVEDNDDVAYLVRFVLQHAGAEVRMPTTWAELLDPASWTGIDVAVVDLQLGDPQISGVHVLRFLAGELSHIRRVVFTASVVENEHDPAYSEALGLGDVYVSKLDATDELLEAVLR